MSRVKRKKTSGPSLDDENAIWEFVYENLCQKKLHADADESLFRQYLEENPDKKWSIEELMDYFNNSMIGTLYKCDLPAETVLSLYKALDIAITPHVEMLLEQKFCATLRIDADRCLHSFSVFSVASRSPKKAKAPATSDTPEEHRRRKQPMNCVPHDMQVSETFEKMMWEHIFDNYDRLSMEVLMSRDFWQEMIERRPDMPIQSAKLLLHHYCSRMLDKLYMQNVEAEKRLNIYKLMDITMTEEAKKWFKEKDRVRVQVSFQGYVTCWEEEQVDQKPAPQLRNLGTWVPRNTAPNLPSTSNSAPLPLRRTPSPQPDVMRLAAPEVESEEDPDDDARESTPFRMASRANSDFTRRKRVQFTETDRLNVWDYVYKQIRKSIQHGTPVVLPKGLTFWTNYVRKTGSSKTAANWSSHFRKQMCPTLYEMRLPREQILFLYQNIEIEISDHLHQILERKFNAKLRIGRKRQLLSWKIRDGEQREESDVEEDEEEGPEDIDSTLPLDSDEEELNQAMDQRQDSSDEEEPEEPEMATSTPKKKTTPTTFGTLRTPRTPRSQKNPLTSLESGTSRIAISGGTSRRSKRRRSSIRGEPIRVMPDLDQDRQPDEVEETYQMTTPPPSSRRPTRRSEGREERSFSKKTTRASNDPEEQESPSKMTLRPRPETSPSKKTPVKKPATPVTSPNKTVSKNVPQDSSEDVPESAIPESFDMFLQSNVAEAGETLSDEEEPEISENMQKLMDLNTVDSEYMLYPELLEAIQQTMDEIDNDGAIEMIGKAVEEAFKKENWDESGTLESSLYRKIATIIKTNTKGAHQAALLKHTDACVKKLLSHVENRQVYDARVNMACELLEKKSNPKPEEEEEEDDEPSSSSN